MSDEIDRRVRAVQKALADEDCTSVVKVLFDRTMDSDTIRDKTSLSGDRLWRALKRLVAAQIVRRYWLFGGPACYTLGDDFTLRQLVRTFIQWRAELGSMSKDGDDEASAADGSRMSQMPRGVRELMEARARLAAESAAQPEAATLAAQPNTTLPANAGLRRIPVTASRPPIPPPVTSSDKTIVIANREVQL